MMVRATRLGVYPCGDPDCTHDQEVDPRTNIVKSCLERRYPANHPVPVVVGNVDVRGKAFKLRDPKDFSDASAPPKLVKGILLQGWMEKVEEPALVSAGPAAKRGK